MTIRILMAISLLMSLATAQLTWDGCEDLRSSDFSYERVFNPGDHGGMGGPLRLAIAESGQIFVSDFKSGSIYSIDPSENYQAEEIGRVEMVSDQWHGMNGMALPPDFMETGHIYTITSQGSGADGLASAPGKFRLSRFTLNGNQLDTDGEKIIVEWGIDSRDAHHGGDIDFDAEGNLYWSTGNDAYAHAAYLPNQNQFTYYGGPPTPLDERNLLMNALKSSANTNDLRGKVNRIKPINVGTGHPMDDWGIGVTYTIPEGNMFPPGMERTRPEVFSMGMRNPYGIHVEPGGTLFIGEVGPENAPPQGGDQFYITNEPANFGHPMFVNGNPYHIRDFEDNSTSGYFDAEFPVNYSIHNTGLDTLPPVTDPTIFKSHNQTINDEQGWGFKNGRMSLFAGPLYWYNGNNPSTVKFPPHFNGKWFGFDAEQNLFHIMTLSEDNEVLDVTDFFEPGHWSTITDMEFGPDGNLYVLSHRSGAGLVRINYTGNCHPDLPIEVKTHEQNFPTQKLTRFIPRGTQFVPVPEKAVHMELFSLQGRVLWGTEVTSGQHEIEIPRGIHRGMGLVKFTTITGN